MDNQPTTTHLPNEIWLQIASYTSPRDIWLCLRPVNHQLRLCAEQHFSDTYLSQITLALPIALPTYDIRSPIRGRAVFQPVRSAGPGGADPDRMVFELLSTEPEHYRSHFVGRWKGMGERNAGVLDERMKWELGFDGVWGPVKLRRPRVEGPGEDGDGDGDEEGDGRRETFSFEWRWSVTSFFR